MKDFYEKKVKDPIDAAINNALGRIYDGLNIKKNNMLKNYPRFL